MRLLTLSLASTLLLTVPALAAPVDAATGQKLASDLTALIKSHLGEVEGFSLNGDITVTPDGDGYALSIPQLRVKDDDGEAHTAAMTGRITPLSDDEYRYSINMPSPLATMFNSTGIPILSITAAASRLQGVYSMKLNNNMSADMMLSGLRLNDLAKSATLAEIGGIVYQARNRITGDKLDMRSTMGMSNIVASIDGKEALHIASVGGSLLNRGMNFAQFQKLEQTIRENRHLLSDSKGAIPYFAAIMNDSGKVGGDVAATFFVKDIRVQTPQAGKDQDGGATWTLPLLRADLTSTCNAQILCDGGITYRHEGLTTTAHLSDMVAGLLPTTLDLGFMLEKMPQSEIADIAKKYADLLTTPSKNEPDEAALYKQAADELLKVTSAAGTTLRFNSVDVASPWINNHTAGAFTVTPDAAFKVTGALDTRINGLDETITKLTALASGGESGSEGGSTEDKNSNKPMAQPDPMLQNALIGLSMLQGFGQQVADANPSARTYKIEVGADGTVKLNGTDLGAMLGMAGGMGGGMGGRHK